MSKAYRVTCKNRRNKEPYSSHADWPQCSGCQFVFTHVSNDGPSYDVCRCDSPLSIRFGETIEVIPERVRMVKPRKKKKKGKP
jgi:hypothetical protein